LKVLVGDLELNAHPFVLALVDTKGGWVRDSHAVCAAVHVAVEAVVAVIAVLLDVLCVEVVLRW
jgi:hypothetical protein